MRADRLHELAGPQLTDSRYEYVRQFEQPDALLANTWIVVRIDGRGFSKYVHQFSLLHLSWQTFSVRHMQVPVTMLHERILLP